MIIHWVPKTYGYTTSFKLRQLRGPRVPTQFDSRAWFWGCGFTSAWPS